MKKILVSLWAISLTVSLAACRDKGQSGAMLSDAQRKAVLAFTEPIIDNLLEGWNEDNYTVLSKDFSPDVLKSISQDAFEKLRKDEFTGLGRYFSRDVESVVQRNDGSYTVIYYGVFENNNETLIRVTFQADSPHSIRALSFNK